MQNEFQPSSINLDPWEASSLLQKSIRRGDRARASYAVRCLYGQRGQSVWRRLMVIAFEDVGIADPDLVAEITFLATDRSLRSVVGTEEEMLVEQTVRLADAGKDRSADYLYCAAVKQDDWFLEMAHLKSRPGGDYLAIATDTDQPLVKRARSAIIACTKGQLGTEIELGRPLDALMASFERNCPPTLISALSAAVRKTAHPFTLMLPILWQALGHETCQPDLISDVFPAPEFEGGIPLYTFDKHTRIGKRAVDRLLRENEGVRETVSRYCSEPNIRSVAEMAAFYVDAIPVAHRLKWSLSRILQSLGLEADMLSAGASLTGVKPIIRCVSDNIGQLNSLRREILSSRSAGS